MKQLLGEKPNKPITGQRAVPLRASPGWPGWVCRNDQEHRFPPGTDKKKCPECLAPLVRWRSYEEKR